MLPAPHTLDVGGTRKPVNGIEPGFLLCVSRLLSYKNIDAVMDAVAGLPAQRLVIVGTGPEEKRLRARAPRNVSLLGCVKDDAELRWLYAASGGLIAASHEDYGLTPLEAAAFGRPVAALRSGGYLDTVVQERTGVFFDHPHAAAMRDAINRLRARRWDESQLRAHAARFTERRFIQRLREVVDEELELATSRTSTSGGHGSSV